MTFAWTAAPACFSRPSESQPAGRVYQIPFFFHTPPLPKINESLIVHSFIPSIKLSGGFDREGARDAWFYRALNHHRDKLFVLRDYTTRRAERLFWRSGVSWTLKFEANIARGKETWRRWFYMIFENFCRFAVSSLFQLNIADTPWFSELRFFLPNDRVNTSKCGNKNEMTSGWKKSPILYENVQPRKSNEMILVKSLSFGVD